MLMRFFSFLFVGTSHISYMQTLHCRVAKCYRWDIYTNIGRLGLKSIKIKYISYNTYNMDFCLQNSCIRYNLQYLWPKPYLLILYILGANMSWFSRYSWCKIWSGNFTLCNTSKKISLCKISRNYFVWYLLQKIVWICGNNFCILYSA